MFFRDKQAAIKEASPDISFGEISKMVAFQWESLSADEKLGYKTKTENLRKEYLKQLAVYQASVVSGNASGQSCS
jgi:hypothetical protein